MLREFKAFIKRGNVLEFAVAVIIAGAFGGVVSSFTNDVLLPPIGMVLGGTDFSDLKIILQAAKGEDVPEVAVRWGQWVNYIIDFLIIAFILFLIVKAYNKFDPPPAPGPAEPAGPSQEELLIEIRDLLKK